MAHRFSRSGPCWRPFQAVQGPDDRLLPLQIAVLDGHGQCAAFDQDPKLAQVTQVVGGRLGNPKTLLWQEVDQSLGHEPVECLAYDGSTDAELVGQQLEPEAGARCKAALQDLVANVLDRLVVASARSCHAEQFTK